MLSSVVKNIILLLIFSTFIGCSLMPDELTKAENLMDTSPDSALKILKQGNHIQFLKPSQKALYALLLSQAYDKNDIEITSDSLITIATRYFDDKQPVRAGYAWFYAARCARNRNDQEVEANALLKAQDFAEMTENFKLKGLIYTEKAMLLQSQMQFDSMIVENKKGYYEFLKSNDVRNAVLTSISIGYGFSHLEQYDSAIHYYNIAMKLSTSLHDNTLTNTIYKALGNVSLRRKKFDEALEYYRKSPLTKIELYDSNKWYLIANTFIYLNKIDSSKFYLNKIKQFDIMVAEYYTLLEKIYEKENNPTLSLFYAKRIIKVKDSLNKISLKNSFSGLEKKYHFEHLSLENKNLIIKNKQKSIIILIGLLLISFIFIMSLNWRFQTKKRELKIQQQLNQQKIDLLAKADENNELLHRQTRMQHILLQNVEQYKNQSTKGSFINPNKTPQIPISKIEEEIIVHIDSIYNNISTRLIEKFPKLTQRDILICCMLLADFDTGMIATVLDVRYESINIHRSRLRKKLQIANSVNFVEFLRNF